MIRSPMRVVSVVSALLVVAGHGAAHGAPHGAAPSNSTPPRGSSTPSGEAVVLNDNGAWSWFQGPRAVVDPAGCLLLVSSVADAGSSVAPERDGDIEVIAHDLASSGATRSTLQSGAGGNDHNSAALYVREDGRYLAMYSLHDSDTLTRWRISSRPGDATEWGPEHTVDNGAPTSYANVYPVPDEGLVYAFMRAAGRDPHLRVSEDDGTSWRDGGPLLTSAHRPYVRYAADGAGRIHLVATDAHPSGNEVITGVYHGVIADRRLLRSDGAVVDGDLFDGDAASADELTQIFAAGEAARPWVIDLRLDDDGNPRVVLSVRVPGDSPETDRRTYHYGRFDGEAWHVYEMARAGSALAAAHRDYTGLAALDPRRPERVVVSTDVDPETGEPLISDADGEQHFELFAGETTDGGETWTWTPLTADSPVDNIRPIVPDWDDGTVVVWLRGAYRDYRVYDTEVVAMVTAAGRCRRRRRQPNQPERGE